MKSFLTVALTSLVLFTADAVRAEPGDAIVGTWLTANGEAKVHFAKESGSYVGRVVWLKSANPKMMGTAIVWGLHYDGNDSYVDGRCFDPQSGKTYSGKATLESTNRLALRGYVGIPLFGRSETWARTN